MSIFIFGLNHKTAPLPIREKIAFPRSTLSHALISLRSYPYIEESIILSTCNRVELYVESLSPLCAESLKQFIMDYHELTDDIFTYCFLYRDRAAVHHLFSVVASLDSMVIGENQILNQVKEAYFKAKSCEVVGKILSMLFEEAIKVGKKVRSQTHIGSGAVSISTSAVELAKSVMASLEGKKVLIVGAGTIGELIVKNLAQRGVKTICVANRTYGRAVRLARDFGGEAINFNAFKEVLSHADIVISSTNAPHYVIKKDDIAKVMQERTTPLFLIDLGVPRNIEQTISNIDDVFLYNIDDLESVCEKNLAKRWVEVKEAKKIVKNTLDCFLNTINLIECSRRKL